MKFTRTQTSLVGQVLAVNVLLVVATLFAASAAANLDLRLRGDRWSFLLLALTILLVLLVNIMMLRRRFGPLEQLIERVEAVDPAQGGDVDSLETGARGAAAEEIDRLTAAFKRPVARGEMGAPPRGRVGPPGPGEEPPPLGRHLHDEVNQALTAILLR